MLRYPLIMLFLLAAGISVNAEEYKDEKLAYFVIGSGLEYLSYTENEPETDSHTNSSLYNIVTKFEGGLNLSHVFVGIKGVFPVSSEEKNEEWVRSERVYQTNDLEYSMTRIDGNIGYRIYPWLSPYVGLRWSKSRQERYRFVLSEPVSGKAIETTRALFAAGGLNGILKTVSPWQFQYSFECFLPVYARTENSALSGWKSSEKDGYSIGARAVAEYKCSPSLSLYYELSGEKTYWGGSGWIDYTEGSAKWPENKTILINFTMGIAWVF